MLGVLVGLGPWILFWVLNSNNTFEEAAVAALVASIAVLAWSLGQGSSLKILEVGSVLVFAALALLAFTADEKFFAEWSYVLANGALAAIVLVSILIGRSFARQYAEESVPEQYWESPTFVQSTLVISWAWFAAFVVMAGSSALTVAEPDQELWFNWVIPIGALIVAFKFTKAYPDHLKQQQHDPSLTGL